MSREEILRGVEAVVRDILNDPSIQLDAQTEALDVSGWDSLHHVRILMGVENRFGVRFDMDEIQDLMNVGELAELVAKHLSAR